MEQLFLMPGQERCERLRMPIGCLPVSIILTARCAVLSLIVKAAVWKKRAPVRGLAGRSGSLLSQLNFGIFDSVCKQRKSLCFPAGDTAGKRRFFSFQLFPQLGTNQFQHAARNAASFI